MPGFVLVVPIFQWNAASTPASAPGTTRQLTDGVNELVPRISFPTRWLPTAGDHDTGPGPRAAGLDFDRRRQVHQQGHRTQDTLGVIYQLD